MCMEDIRLGREMGYNTGGVIIAAAQQFTIEANYRRVNLLITCSGTSFGQINVDELRTDTVIAYLAPGYNHIDLNIGRHGQLVTKRFIVGNASASNMNFSWCETILDKF